MAEIVSGVEIGRGADEVFAYVTDPSRFGEWQGEGVKGHVEGDGPAHVGSRCVITRPIGGTDRTSTREALAPEGAGSPPPPMARNRSTVAR